MKLSPAWRKGLLTVHVVTAVGWLGASAVLLTLAVAGLRGADEDVVYPAYGLIGLNLLVPLSVVTWATSVLVALLTPWGLIKHWWVLTKLVITTILTGLVLFSLRPTLLQVVDPEYAVPAGFQSGIMMPPAVSVTALIVATLLSTYKPWGRLRRRPAAADQRRKTGQPAARVPSTIR